MRDEKITYGPNGKTYSDYSVFEEIIMKKTGMLFKYSKGKPNGGGSITGLVRSEDDVKLYRDICDKVCKELRNCVDVYTHQREGR